MMRWLFMAIPSSTASSSRKGLEGFKGTGTCRMVDGQPEWIISFRALSSGSDVVCSSVLDLRGPVNIRSTCCLKCRQLSSSHCITGHSMPLKAMFPRFLVYFWHHVIAASYTRRDIACYLLWCLKNMAGTTYKRSQSTMVHMLLTSPEVNSKYILQH